MTNRVVEEDLKQVLSKTADLWRPYKGSKIFMTGGTGFFGKLLLESFLKANEELGLQMQATLLTRDPDAFLKKHSQFDQPSTLTFVRGDVRDFELKDTHFDLVIHAANYPSGTIDLEDPLLMFDTIVEGTRRVLDLAVKSGAKRFLYTSSGAVYGSPVPEVQSFNEDHIGAPNPLSKGVSYGEGKRVAEMLCAMYHEKYGLETAIARCFAVTGPYLPLDGPFAMGNFIQDALKGRRVEILGDGTPYRSYLYTSDLVTWLWTILFKGRPARAYNVGSEQPISIAQLAQTIASMCGSTEGIHIAKTPQLGKSAERYVPSVKRAQEELGLSQVVGFEEAIRRTVEFYKG